jgi:Fe-S oxidoreductase
MPRLANFVTHAPVVSDLVKRFGGIAPQRRVPSFAGETFTSWFRRRSRTNREGRRVLLWPDTFNDHFFPGTLKAAVEVLEAAGCRVEIPTKVLCCGRPLYDYGMLDTARGLLADILDSLAPQIAAGIPIIGLEPSCVSVFRDELTNLFPHNENAQRLKHSTYTLAEYLTDELHGYRPPQLHRKAIVHGHCHHKAIMKFNADEELLKRMGLDFRILDSGCCGMAGAFGFEQEHYDVSIAVGERVLLPAVRNADDDTLVVADGFSCREQIEQVTERRALHLAEVLQMALHEERSGGAGARPIPANGHGHRNGHARAGAMPDGRTVGAHSGNGRVHGRRAAIGNGTLARAAVGAAVGAATVALVGGAFYWLKNNEHRYENDAAGE